MGGTSTMKHSGASGAMQRVKCRTGSRSRSGGCVPQGRAPGPDRVRTAT